MEEKIISFPRDGINLLRMFMLNPNNYFNITPVEGTVILPTKKGAIYNGSKLDENSKY